MFTHPYMSKRLQLLRGKGAFPVVSGVLPVGNILSHFKSRDMINTIANRVATVKVPTMLRAVGSNWC